MAECRHCGEDPDANGVMCCDAWLADKYYAEKTALAARLAEADAAVRAFVAWLEHDDTSPKYPPGTNRDTPGNEAIWRDWWDEANHLCAKSLHLGRAYVRRADNGSGGT